MNKIVDGKPMLTAPKGIIANADSRFRLLRRFVYIITIVAAITFTFVVLEDEAEKNEKDVTIPTEEAQNVLRAKIIPPKFECTKLCDARQLLRPPELLARATSAREEMIHSFKKNYGDVVFKAMFEEPDGTSRGHTAFWGAGDDGENGERQGPSKARFRRKIKIKLLEVQHSIQEKTSNVTRCDCSSEKDRRLVEKSIYTDPPEVSQLPLTYASFVWATGGHSAAAGHGNLFNESYTAVMERAAKAVYRSVGIDFVGRNYAIGSMCSSPEIALCQESLFGIDADLISWDFGMSDGHAYVEKLFYANRIGMHRNKPATMDINIEGRTFGNRREQLKRVEEQGMSAMFIHPRKMKELENGIPDMYGMSTEDMAKVAPYARDFKCKDTLEKGDPTCDANKYNDAICPNRKHKASWHPGWHANAAYGTLLALFMTDMLVDAIKELGVEPYDPLATMASLRREVDVEYSHFYESKPELPEELVGKIDLDFGDKAFMEVYAKMFRTRNVICHTGLLPSQIRFLGILTESDKVGTRDFDRGVSQQQADADRATDDEKDKRPMRLAFDTSERQLSCPVDLQWDYKDFFYSTQNDGWTSLTVPNMAERAHYKGPGAYEPEGIILLCFVYPDRSIRPDGDMQFEEIVNGKLKLEVNGIAVTNVTRVQYCGLLQHGDGDYYFMPSNSSQFEFRALVGKADEGMTDSFMRISSIIVM